VITDGRSISRGEVVLEAAAPALFTADLSGEGPPPGVLITVIEGFSRTDGLVLCSGGAGACDSLPLDLFGMPGDVYIGLFGTGLRGHGGLSNVNATIGGEDVPVSFAGPQGEFAGLDQVNLGPLPRALAGLGEVEINISAGGKRSNPVTVTVR
jgi:uncharacterized protein (TIGR03437 family)